MSPQFCPNQLFAKLSLLFFYHRIFWVDERFSLWLWVVGIVQILWMISVYLAKWMLCWPVAYTWDKTLPGGKCINIPVFLAASETVNSVIDFVMLALAIQVLSNLQISMGEKLRVGVLFSLGTLYVQIVD
jgi:hypothetical protein